jgi:hypothetical protein
MSEATNRCKQCFISIILILMIVLHIAILYYTDKIITDSDIYDDDVVKISVICAIISAILYIMMLVCYFCWTTAGINRDVLIVVVFTLGSLIKNVSLVTLFMRWSAFTNDSNGSMYILFTLWIPCTIVAVVILCNLIIIIGGFIICIMCILTFIPNKPKSDIHIE